MGISKRLFARPITVFRQRVALFCILVATSLICIASAQRPFREFPGWEYENFPLPPDWQVQGEWAFARLMYPSVRYSDRPYSPFWQLGATNWTIDYPRSDRHLSAALRRLTRVQARSIE